MVAEKDKLKLNQALELEKWTYKGKPLRILSTTLGIALVANMLIMSSAYGAAPSPSAEVAGSPTLVEFSTEAVKKYYDPNADWNIPVPFDENGQPLKEAEAGTEGNLSTGNTTIINNGGGYGGGGIGWTDLLLYHMIFNSGNSFSSNRWNDSRPIYNSGTNKTYSAKNYTPETFTNKPTNGSKVTPKTTKKSGVFSTKNNVKSTANTKATTNADTSTKAVTKATSSKKSGIGGKSGGFSSSSKSSGSSSFGS